MSIMDKYFIVGIIILLFFAVQPLIIMYFIKDKYIKELCTTKMYSPYNDYFRAFAVWTIVLVAGRVLWGYRVGDDEAEAMAQIMLFPVLFNVVVTYLFFIIPVCFHEAKKYRKAIKEFRKQNDLEMNADSLKK